MLMFKLITLGVSYMMLPISPLTGQSLPWSPQYMQVANNIKQTGSVVPYSSEYLKSVGIDLNIMAKKV